MATLTQPVTQDIVAKLWNLCNVLKDDGVTYHQYVTELTYLLFLKMAKETNTEPQLPDGYRWDDLETKSAPERLTFYKSLLLHLGEHGSLLGVFDEIDPTHVIVTSLETKWPHAPTI